MKYKFLLVLFCLPAIVAFSQKKGKGKDKDKKPAPVILNVNVDDQVPKPDSASRFTGIIKYKITTDDPADRDSMIVAFGENRIRVTMFTPGYREGQVFENTMIANFLDSSFTVLDPRTKTYHIEKLGDRNKDADISLINYKKTAPIMKFICNEYSGEMKTGDEQFEAAALVSKQHSYLYAQDYNFLNIQPLVMSYRIVLGWRTKTSENDNTYIIAYEIMPGDVSSMFNYSDYKQK
jgi:hypothetical protein